MNASQFDPLLQELAKKDFLTYQHSVAVAELMKRFALLMKLDENTQGNAELIGAIHDLGKTLVDTEIFKKLQAGSPLTDDERKKLHSKPGDLIQLLGPDQLSGEIVQAIEQMHCRYDGLGTPSLAKEDICLLSRMLNIVNYYDMLTRQRTGRVPLTELQSRQVLNHQQGRLFDPALVKIFLKVLEA